MYLIVWSFAIASVLGAALCFGGTRYLARLTTVPFAVLGPGLVVIMLLGAFQESGQLGDLWVMIALGVFGWLLKATDYPRAPFLIGFVLAVPLERYYFLDRQRLRRRRLDAAPGGAGLRGRCSWDHWCGPSSRSSAAPWAQPTTGTATSSRSRSPRATSLEGSMAGTGWSFAVALVAVVMFVGALWASGSFSEEARLMPPPDLAVRLVAAGALLWRSAAAGAADARSRRPRG